MNKVFLTHREDDDFSEAVCGCILERRLDGEGSNFRMCELHRKGYKLAKAKAVKAVA